MIGYLRGQIVTEGPNQILVLVEGVGYEVHCSLHSVQRFQEQKNGEVWIHTHLREDALVLFGFSERRERELFLSLIKVNGIGPKTAVNILSAAPLEQLIEMVEQGDVKRLSKLPKVGKKTAEQMILTLKGKLEFVPEGGPIKKTPTKRSELVSALVNLGFRLNDVEKVVGDIQPDLDLQEGVRRALAALTT